jgi:hypothetical protein
MAPALKGISRAFLLAAMASGLAVSGIAGPSRAQADEGAGLCASLQGQGTQNGYRVLDTKELTHVRARPWHIVTDGVAYLIQAPRGTTEADLHRDALRCREQGDQVSVKRAGANYVVKVTSAKPARALELARR